MSNRIPLTPQELRDIADLLSSFDSAGSDYISFQLTATLYDSNGDACGVADNTSGDMLFYVHIPEEE